MNYLKIYDQIIDKYRNELPSGYSEKHHVTPRCIGGTNDISNIVRLPAKAHFVAHLLLAKIYGGKLVTAAWMMSNRGLGNGKKYKWLREEHARVQAKNAIGNKHWIGKKHSKETKEKIRKAKVGKLRSFISKKISEKSNERKNRKMPDWLKEKLLKANLGKKQSLERVEKRRKFLIGNKFALGTIHTTEYRDRCRHKMIGNKINNGRKQSPEIVQKRMAAIKKSREEKAGGKLLQRLA